MAKRAATSAFRVDSESSTETSGRPIRLEPVTRPDLNLQNARIPQI